jgi:TolB protein
LGRRQEGIRILAPNPLATTAFRLSVMGKCVTWATTFLLVLVSCTEDTSNRATPTSAVPDTSAPETPATPTDQGRLAILDGSGDIVVMDPDGSNREAITDSDRNPSIFMQPIWSPDASALAWGQATGNGFGVGISKPGADEITTLTTPNLPFFTYWSPNNRHLGVLHNGTSGVQFQIADIDQQTTSVLDEDTPFYFSWSPEGDRVVTHAGPTRAETIRPDGEREALQPTAAGYLAPQWTASGVFHVVDDRLVVEDESGDRQTVAVVSGVTMFVANAEGTLVAVQSTGDGPGPITASTEDFPVVGANTVLIIDVVSGQAETVSEGLSVGFFWSPDGVSLLVLTTSEGGIVPLVWIDGEQTGFPGYSPSPSMVQDTFPFFPQYAQSVRFWSPGSAAFAYAGEVDGEAGIWVQDLDSETPRRVSDGRWVAWSGSAP